MGISRVNLFIISFPIRRIRARRSKNDYKRYVRRRRLHDTHGVIFNRYFIVGAAERLCPLSRRLYESATIFFRRYRAFFFMSGAICVIVWIVPRFDTNWTEKSIWRITGGRILRIIGMGVIAYRGAADSFDFVGGFGTDGVSYYAARLMENIL